MWAELLNVTFVTGLLVGTIRIATPILYAAIGELITERAGILNLGVEGNVLIGAFAGFLVAYNTGSLWLGVAAAVLAGAALSLLFGLLVVTLKVDQTVAGLTTNLFAGGISFYFYRISFADAAAGTLPHLDIFQVVRIPVLSNIPILGEALFSQFALTYIVLLLVPLIGFILYRTHFGLELRCLGENPRALDMKGVNVSRYQYLAVMFGGAMAGAGGSFLTLGSAGIFVPAISAGRGWIAIAIVIFGGWRLFNSVLGALFFGLLDSFQLQIQGLGFQFPYQALLALPYLLTIVAVVVGRRRSGAPISLGVPYRRE